MKIFRKYIEVQDYGKLLKKDIRYIVKSEYLPPEEETTKLITKYPAIEIAYSNIEDKTLLWYYSFEKRDSIFNSIMEQL